MAGDLGLLRSPCVVVVGSRRSPSVCGRWALIRRRTPQRSPLEAGLSPSSGLRWTVATRNATLQCRRRSPGSIYCFRNSGGGAPVVPQKLPQRNRTMAAVSDATVIIEAFDESGTLHQAVECVNLGRPLFILRSLVNDSRVVAQAGAPCAIRPCTCSMTSSWCPAFWRSLRCGSRLRRMSSI